MRYVVSLVFVALVVAFNSPPDAAEPFLDPCAGSVTASCDRMARRLLALDREIERARKDKR